MANDARTKRPNANPPLRRVLRPRPGSRGRGAAGTNSNPPAFLARYVRHYEKLRAEGVDVQAAMKLVREEVEREQAAARRALFAQVPRRRRRRRGVI